MMKNLKRKIITFYANSKVTQETFNSKKNEKSLLEKKKPTHEKFGSAALETSISHAQFFLSYKFSSICIYSLVMLLP